jgi:hypothetical protein
MIVLRVDLLEKTNKEPQSVESFVRLYRRGANCSNAPADLKRWNYPARGDSSEE